MAMYALSPPAGAYQSCRVIAPLSLRLAIETEELSCCAP